MGGLEYDFVLFHKFRLSLPFSELSCVKRELPDLPKVMPFDRRRISLPFKRRRRGISLLT